MFKSEQVQQKENTLLLGETIMKQLDWFTNILGIKHLNETLKRLEKSRMKIEQ